MEVITSRNEEGGKFDQNIQFTTAREESLTRQGLRALNQRKGLSRGEGNIQRKVVDH